MNYSRAVFLTVLVAMSACSRPSGAQEANQADREITGIAKATVSNLSAPVPLQQGPIVPAGWAKQWVADGDLNGDGVPDQVLLLKENADSVDGRRRLLIVFQQADGTRSVVVDTDSFLPVVENGMDPFSDDNPLTIKNRTLRVYIEGSGSGLTHEEYIFRFQHSDFELIGYDAYAQGRGTGEYESTSVNYSTGVVERSTGNIENEKEAKTKSRFSQGKLPSLRSINLTLGFQPFQSR